MSQACNIIAMPVARSKQYIAPEHPATVTNISEFRAPSPITTLQGARERLIQHLPPKPHIDGMSEWEAAAACLDWARKSLLVYETVMFT